MECEDYHLQLGVACSASGPRLRFKTQETELFKTLRERLKLDKRTKLEAIAAAVDLYPKVSMYPCVARDLPRNEQDSGDARAAAQLPRAA